MVWREGKPTPLGMVSKLGHVGEEIEGVLVGQAGRRCGGSGYSYGGCQPVFSVYRVLRLYAISAL